jgi:hypothetical protein
MALHKFKVGELLQPDDNLSLYLANLAMAFNDLVFTNVKMDEVASDWDPHLSTACRSAGGVSRSFAPLR